MKTELSQYGIGKDAPEKIADNFAKNNTAIGEHHDIMRDDIVKILSL